MSERLTPAQGRALALMRRPGAVLKPTARMVVWWTVWQDGVAIGRVHAATFARLRDLDLLVFMGHESGVGATYQIAPTPVEVAS